MYIYIYLYIILGVVSLHFYIWVTCRFQYLPALRVVTAELESSSNNSSSDSDGGLTLCDLYPNDSGEAMPHLSTEANVTAALARSGGLSAALPGRPYKWLQWVCGLYRNEMQSSLERQQASTTAVLARLAQRVRSRHALESQLKTLSSTPGVVPLPATLAALFAGSESGQTGSGSGKSSTGVKLNSWLQLKTKENLESVTKGFAVMDYPGDASLKAEKEQADGGGGAPKFDRRRFYKVTYLKVDIKRSKS